MNTSCHVRTVFTEKYSRRSRSRQCQYNHNQSVRAKCVLNITNNSTSTTTNPPTPTVGKSQNALLGVGDSLVVSHISNTSSGDSGSTCDELSCLNKPTAESDIMRANRTCRTIKVTDL